MKAIPLPPNPCFTVFLATVLAIFLTHGIAAQDWTEFRGSTGQGLSAAKQLPLHWNPSSFSGWEVEIAGSGWSSPIVHRGRLYLTVALSLGNSDAGDQSLRTMCLDAKTGTTIWDVEVFQPTEGDKTRIHAKNSHASATPITDGKRIYVHFGPHGTAALDLDGKILWTNQTLEYDPQHGTGSSPVLSGDLVIFNCDGADTAFVTALDQATGKERWRTMRPTADSHTFSFSTPLEIEANGKTQVVSPASHVVCSYDVETGEEIWRVRYPERWSVVPRPVYSQGMVFVCTGYMGPAGLLAIRTDGQGDVTETHVAWQTDEHVPHNPSPLVVGSEIYMVSDDGVATCRDVLQGNLHWRKRLGGNYSASPIYGAGRIYFQSEDGLCTVIQPGTRFQQLAKNEMGERSLASFAVWDDALFIRTLSHLYRINSEAGP